MVEICDDRDPEDKGSSYYVTAQIRHRQWGELMDRLDRIEMMLTQLTEPPYE